MSKNVVLFLTTPNSLKRKSMCLENFKQLKKLGYDIITLTTTHELPDYLYEKSKYVIHDYNLHNCSKKEYYNFFIESNGTGYFFWDSNPDHLVRLFHDTHFPSLLRNTRTLIQFAFNLGYKNYFFVEDDHFFHDDDLETIKNYFDLLSETDLIVFEYKRFKCESLYCTWFHFGNVSKSNNLFKNFAYTTEEFLSNKIIYLNCYEFVFYRLVKTHKLDDLKLMEVNEPVTKIFSQSKLNKIYSFCSLDNDSRCNLLLDKRNNSVVFYYTALGLFENVNIKMYMDDKIFCEQNIYAGCWFLLRMQENEFSTFYIIINDKIKKTFKGLNVNNITFNGEVCQK